MASDDLQRFIDELRARISIADVVGAKVKLVKKGREYQGLCPFHNEKTPSFTVNETKGFYHCFGCGAHGDIIKFEMEANGLPFMDALQKLAHQAGLTMPQFSAKDKSDAENKKSLYDIMEQACLFFEKELRMPDGHEGFNYFTQKRGLSKEIIQKFRLGYAPNNNALMAHLKKLGINEADLKELGLIAIPEDKTRHPHDFFRNRVMIPITNKQGKIIAFGGRVMEKIEPKYLNSPDTPIFNKRRNLYNLDKAREIAYKEKRLIICEGYMDVIALDRFGFGYAVAPLGTALTEEQIIEAWKVCCEPILCLDGDTPGIKAAMRAVDRVLPILKAGYSLKFLFLPDNQDPDEYLQAHGANSFAALMAKTKPLIDILWQKYTENEDSSTPEKKALIEQTLLAEVNKIADTTVRNYYAHEIKNRIYLAYKQTPWQRKTETSSSGTLTLSKTNTADNVIFPTQKKSTNNNTQYSYRHQNNKHYLIQHSFASIPPRHNTNTEQDKNIRFIIAAELIYPELIDDYEEAIFLDDIKDQKLQELQTTIADTFHNSDVALSGDDLVAQIAETSVGKTLKTLWEWDMIKKQNPFINDLRHQIDSILQQNKRRALEEEIKKLTTEVCLNFDEEKFNRLSELKKNHDEMLRQADAENAY
ncbi:MAG: DNA primase [Alphaproteobacteria bacterium]|nr:DNA primase [Alphaproteobacteria bacterium]